MTTVPARHDTPADTGAPGLPPGLDGPARAWLADALTEAARAAQAEADPGGTWQIRFAEAGRRCGPGHADAARVELLAAARPGVADLTALYRQGTAAERRAVLLALGRLEPAAAEGLALVEDALRTNDTSLVAAALGPYAAAHLPAHAWRHGVLKCLFTGVPVAAVAGLSARARGDGELGRMLRAYAAERTAAGRPVPHDLTRVLALTEEP
ncbi:EboA domain-containing protein [Actinacidiphila acididurans]|uniref:EboA domain-containing protein n=1 Tax=Actinacidiphila acididurans TaxID=2784346 RepID=A0ABS2TT13_9ACTN|nr:EboA domain-containing protein [Actinacidiphila acididurans]MBM9506478.1 EboA domain-containing protein [Actinacidiphila acididurans]